MHLPVCVFTGGFWKSQFSSEQMWDSWVKFDGASYMQGVCSTTQLYLPPPLIFITRSRLWED